MAFIGIITSEKNEASLRRILLRELNENKIKESIIIINESNIDNIKNVKFDTIIINKESNLIYKKQEILKTLFTKTRFLILNSDIYNNLSLIKNLELNIITFGINLKTTVMISSLQNDDICISIQRAIKNSKGDIIEPNEVNLKKINNDVYSRVISYIVVKVYS